MGFFYWHGYTTFAISSETIREKSGKSSHPTVQATPSYFNIGVAQSFSYNVYILILMHIFVNFLISSESKSVNSSVFLSQPRI